MPAALPASPPLTAAPRVPFRTAALWGAGLTAGGYLLGAVLGVFGALTAPAAEVLPASSVPAASAVLVHNAGVLLWLTAGLPTLGLVTVGTMLYNGAVLGWVATEVAGAQGTGPLLTGVLPHLVPELLAYLVSSGATLALSVQLAARVVRGSSRRPEWRAWLHLQGAALLLLALAALVEQHVSRV